MRGGERVGERRIGKLGGRERERGIERHQFPTLDY